MYTGLTQEQCERAFAIVEPAILAAFESGLVKRSHGCLVVCNPSIPREPKYKEKSGPFEEEVIFFRREYGLKTEWEHPYDAVAISKAYTSWKTGLTSYEVQQKAPYLYEVGMAKYGGSAVGEGGLVVAFSGVEEWFDQMFSEMMLVAIKAVCMDEMHSPDGVMADDKVTFIGI